MTTSPQAPVSQPSSPTSERAPLRLRLGDAADGTNGAWWPQSRNLQLEAADLLDHFPHPAGYINRLLMSRPDWDDSSTDGRGVRRIQARRGPVKIGSFPQDDTKEMILAMSSGQRLRLTVIPSDTDPAEGERLLSR
jgi:uncharacterized protein DUF5994